MEFLLTNDEKIRLMELAFKKSTFEDFGQTYKQMVDLVANYEPAEDEKD